MDVITADWHSCKYCNRSYEQPTVCCGKPTIVRTETTLIGTPEERLAKLKKQTPTVLSFTLLRRRQRLAALQKLNAPAIIINGARVLVEEGQHALAERTV